MLKVDTDEAEVSPPGIHQINATVRAVNETKTGIKEEEIEYTYTLSLNLEITREEYEWLGRMEIVNKAATGRNRIAVLLDIVQPQLEMNLANDVMDKDPTQTRLPEDPDPQGGDPEWEWAEKQQ